MEKLSEGEGAGQLRTSDEERASWRGFIETSYQRIETLKRIETSQSAPRDPEAHRDVPIGASKRAGQRIETSQSAHRDVLVSASRVLRCTQMQMRFAVLISPSRRCASATDVLSICDILVLSNRLINIVPALRH
jgi:hypothetical protein